MTETVHAVDDPDEIDSSELNAVSVVLTYDELLALAGATGVEFWISAPEDASASAAAGRRALIARRLAMLGDDDADLMPPLDTMIDVLRRPDRVVLIEEWSGGSSPSTLLVTIEGQLAVSEEDVEGIGVNIGIRAVDDFVTAAGLRRRTPKKVPRSAWPPVESSPLKAMAAEHHRSLRMTLSDGGTDQRSLTLLDCGPHGLLRQVGGGDADSGGDTIEVETIRTADLEAWLGIT